MNDTSRQILSTNKSISNQIAKFCRLTSRFCKILSIKTLFKQKQGIKYTLFKFPKSLNNGLNRSFLYEFSLLSRTFPDSPKIFSIKIPGFPKILEIATACGRNYSNPKMLDTQPKSICLIRFWLSIALLCK